MGRYEVKDVCLLRQHMEDNEGKRRRAFKIESNTMNITPSLSREAIAHAMSSREDKGDSQRYVQAGTGYNDMRLLLSYLYLVDSYSSS